MNLMDMPVEIIYKIISYLSYDQIAKLRAVNRMFNMICSDKLNKGFIFVNQFHNRCLKAVKTKLPRRESERRHHPLARHSDILMAVETRLSMLSMTFSKYIEAHQCCFIPGKVLDEAIKLLRIVNNCSAPLQSNGQFPLLPRPHDFLQEYRDVSSMAMEHFDDKILPGIRETMRLENQRVYCFKSKPGSSQMLVPSRSTGFKLMESMPSLFCGKVSLGHQDTSDGTAPINAIAQGKKKADLAAASPALVRLFKGIQVNKLKCKSVHQSVDRLHRTMRQMAKKFKVENMMLKNQMAQQKIMIKHLRRELRETRAAMNVMSKDLSEIKIDQSTSRGTKRKRENCDEDCTV